MKDRILIALGALGFACIAAAFRLAAENKGQWPGHSTVSSLKKISCSPDWNLINDWIEENEIPRMPGAGNHKWKISTGSDSAQFYFNQGINMYYGFHIIESMASFKKAARFDPNSAMLHWAQALAYGPNINDIGYSASPEALAAVEKSREFYAKATTKEKMLIDAQAVRYSADTSVTRADLNQLYVDKMKAAYDAFPNDADIATLYADALMLQHPWDLWKMDGQPRPWTPLIRSILEKILKTSPDHPGANHYYIHVMEPSPYFAQALPSADRLGRLTPGLSHMVHMPSHIYLRSGNYSKGVAVNENAVFSFKKSVPLYGPVAGNDFLYVIHNLHMKTNHAMLAGRNKYSVKAALETAQSIAPEYLQFPGAMGNYIQYLHMTPTLVDIRFGNWSQLLQRKEPEANLVYARTLYHFGRGMAFCAGSRLEEARKEYSLMKELMNDTVLALPFTPFSPSIDGANVAANLLMGLIELKEGRRSESLNFLESAVRIEDNMVYNEPRDWLLNPKHYLAAAQLKFGSFTDARKTCENDLKNNNNNPWALAGLRQALTGEKNTIEAARVMQRWVTAGIGADTMVLFPAIGF